MNPETTNELATKQVSSHSNIENNLKSSSTIWLKIALVFTIAVLILISGFFTFNSYIYNEKQADKISTSSIKPTPPSFENTTKSDEIPIDIFFDDGTAEVNEIKQALLKKDLRSEQSSLGNGVFLGFHQIDVDSSNTWAVLTGRPMKMNVQRVLEDYPSGGIVFVSKKINGEWQIFTGKDYDKFLEIIDEIPEEIMSDTSKAYFRIN